MEQSCVSAAAPPLTCCVTSGSQSTSGCLRCPLCTLDMMTLTYLRVVVRIERGETYKVLSTMPGTHSVFNKRELLSSGLEFREGWSVSVG